VVEHHIDDRSKSENQDVIGTGNDVYPIASGQVESLLRDLRHLAASFTDLILMIKDIALGLHVHPTLRGPEKRWDSGESRTF
jgi:hypothetical protein